MAQFAQYLTALSPVSRVVVDRTGLDGGFDIQNTFSAGGASIFTAFQEQLGLKLESTTAPVDFLVIDSVEHPISD
jgi:uncharacterized protein (TIGR03435 family)